MSALAFRSIVFEDSIGCLGSAERPAFGIAHDGDEGVDCFVFGSLRRGVECIAGERCDAQDSRGLFASHD